MKKTKIKKICAICFNIILYLFLALGVFSVILTITSKKSVDGASEIFGYELRVVTSDSMAECEQTDVSEYEIKSIPIRSMIFVQKIPQNEAEADEWYRSLEVGDVLTFRYVYTNQVTITHRITSITEKDTGGFLIELAGDNKNADSDQLYQTIDTSIPENMNYVLGKVMGQSVMLGNILTILKSPIGLIFLIIIPCFIIILLEILKIVGAYGAERKKKEQEASARKDDELEELRRRLAALENQRTGDGDQTPPTE